MMTPLSIFSYQTPCSSFSPCTVSPSACGLKVKVVKFGRLSMLSTVTLALLVCLSAMIIDQVEARRSRLQHKLQARYVSNFASVTDLPLKLDITPTAADIYMVKKGTDLHHSTDVLFPSFREAATWMSLDKLEGFKMIVKKAVTADPAAVDMYARKLVANRDLKLFLMKRLQRDSEARLTHYATAAPVGLAAFPGGFPAWYNAPSRIPNAHGVLVPNQVVSDFVDNFCTVVQQHGFDGWRNPWDQDEIMLCPVMAGHGSTIASKVSFNGGWFCPSAKTVGPLATGPAPWDKSKLYYSNVFTDPRPGPVGAPIAANNPGTQRLHYQMMKTVPDLVNVGRVTTNAALTSIDLRAAADASEEYFGKVCCRFDAQYALYQEIEQLKADLLAFPAPQLPVVKRNQQPVPTKEQAQIIKRRTKWESDLQIKQALGLAVNFATQAANKCDK